MNGLLLTGQAVFFSTAWNFNAFNVSDILTYITASLFFIRVPPILAAHPRQAHESR